MNAVETEFDGFDWDEANLEHATRHGISRKQFEEAVMAGISVYRAYERNGEMRYSAFAVTGESVPLDFAFTVRNGRMRPISIHKLKRSRRKPR